MKLSSIIVDDENHARENLRMLLEEYCPEIEVAGTAGSVNEARELIDKLDPKVLFLDIRMPSGAEGFELLDSLPEKKFQVVFVTAFRDYAIKAFNANAVHYILKPVDIDELRSAVDKLIANDKLFQFDQENFQNYLKSIENLEGILQDNLPIQRITINHSKGIKIIEDDDIIHLEASGNCTNLYFNEEDKFLDTRTLKVYEDLLDEKKFYRTHKSHIVNIYYVTEYITEGGHFAIMKDGARIPVARNRAQRFVEVIRSL